MTGYSLESEADARKLANTIRTVDAMSRQNSPDSSGGVNTLSPQLLRVTSDTPNSENCYPAKLVRRGSSTAGSIDARWPLVSDITMRVGTVDNANLTAGDVLVCRFSNFDSSGTAVFVGHPLADRLLVWGPWRGSGVAVGGSIFAPPYYLGPDNDTFEMGDFRWPFIGFWDVEIHVSVSIMVLPSGTVYSGGGENTILLKVGGALRESYEVAIPRINDRTVVQMHWSELVTVEVANKDHQLRLQYIWPYDAAATGVMDYRWQAIATPKKPRY
jgi:hypothetical protein